MRLAGVILALWGISVARPAGAQQPVGWLLLPSAGEPSPEGWSAIAGRVADSLRAEGLDLRDFEEARRLFERRMSAEPAPVERTELDELKERIDRAMVLVATGQRQGALREMNDGMDLLRRASETINREAAVARTAFDGCLITVRALFELRQRDAARERARECQRLFPDIEPNPREHPPWVIGWLAEVRAELDVEARGMLRIESQPRGCPAYLQGLRIGVTPFERGDFTPGEQRIQVECTPGRPGRVHRVILGAESTTVRIDTGFDEVVRSLRGLELRYATADEEDRRRLSDGLIVSRAVGAAELLLATPREINHARAVRVDRIHVEDGSVIATAWIGISDDDRVSSTGAGLAVLALRAGQSIETTRGLTIDVPGWRPPPDDLPIDAPRTEPGPVPLVVRPPVREEQDARAVWPAAVFVPLGAAMIGSGWFFFARDEGHPWDVGLTLSGGVVASVGLPWLLPSDDGVPLWSVAVGVAGLGLVGASLWHFAVDGACEAYFETGGCAISTQSADGGFMLLGSATPLLSVPLYYVVRKLTGLAESPTVSVTVPDRAVQITLQGAVP